MSTVPVSIPAAQPKELRQAILFQRLRYHLLRNGWRVALDKSFLRVTTILGSSLFIWGSVFLLSLLGFLVLGHNLPLLGGLLGLLFDYLFLALTGLLILSCSLILYSSLFKSPEAAFLLCRPAAADQVFAFKFQGALAFSSWAFVLLGSPILLAYGLMAGVPWHFYVFLPLFFLAFLLLPGSVGAILCLLVVNCAPRRPRQLLIVVAVVLILSGVGWLYGLARTAWLRPSTLDAVQQLLGQLTVAQHPLVPSHWTSRGLMAAARNDVGGAFFYLALVAGNGLFLYALTAWVASKLYRRGFNRVATGGMFRKRYGGLWMDRGLSRLVGFLDGRTRLLIVKDFRTFRRDPAQWAQVLIFTGLLSLYFLNIRRLHFDQDIGWAYQNSISLLNLTATAFLLCAYTGRFIFPMLSLEGRKFWILGLLPLERERLLWGKFFFSAVGGLFIAEFLILLGDLMLGVPWPAVLIHVLTVGVLALGLSGLSVGLGACMPNFQESDPSKIAVGFGGTLNLVVGLLFLVATVAVMAGPWHAFAAAGPEFRPTGGTIGVIVAGLFAGLILGGTAVVLPLWMGSQTLRRMEF
jgi:ABC-2 type transport system permease protein